MKQIDNVQGEIRYKIDKPFLVVPTVTNQFTCGESGKEFYRLDNGNVIQKQFYIKNFGQPLIKGKVIENKKYKGAAVGVNPQRKY